VRNEPIQVKVEQFRSSAVTGRRVIGFDVNGHRQSDEWKLAASLRAESQLLHGHQEHADGTNTKLNSPDQFGETLHWLTDRSEAKWRRWWARWSAFQQQRADMSEH